MNSPAFQSQPYVLLTGATGMVGSHMMAKLLARQVSVAVLVRDSAASSGRGAVLAVDRVEHLLAKFEACWRRRLKRPVVLTGDINLDGLGLGDDSLHWLGTHCGSVIHSAASLSFRPAAESINHEPYRSNVDGTANLAAICTRLGIADFHYISTAYVCGVREGRVGEHEAECGQAFANDYEQSKLRAERQLRSNRAWRHLTVYRPSIVIDSTGLAPVSQDRTVYSAFSMFYALASKFGLPELGTWSRNLGLSGAECKNLVEAAWVAEAIVGIFETPELQGQTYHLTSRSGTLTSQMEQAFYDVTAESFRNQGVLASAVPAGDATPDNGFQSRVSSRSLSASSTGSLTGSAVLDAIAAPFVEAYLPHFRDDPIFGRANLDAALRRLALPEQGEIDSAVLAAMIRLPGCFGTNSSEAVTPTASVAESFLARVSFHGAPDCGSNKDRKSVADSLGELGGKSAPPADAWGILICGSCGGDYRVELGKTLQVGPGGEACDRRIYLASQDWDALISGDCDVEELVADGRLLVENDGWTSATRAEELRSSLAGLIDRVRQELGGERAEGDVVPIAVKGNR